jgi:UDP-2-acetamido-3-amino-2,3-dideoxy-glucuronate N-acetyltransferase
MPESMETGNDGGYAPQFVASTAIIETEVTLGVGVKVWHHTQIRTGVIIGAHTVIGKDCFIDEYVVVGERSKIQNGSQIYAPAVIQSGVFIGPHVVLTNDRHPRAISQTGDSLGVKDWMAIGCVVEEGAAVGAGAVVVCTKIGAWALVGAGSVVTKPVLPHALVVGNPARQIGWVCYCGSRNERKCPECGWGTP